MSSPSRRERKSLRAERRRSRQAPPPPCDGGQTGHDAHGLSLSHLEVALVNLLGLSPHLLLRGFHLRRAETSTADQTRASGFTSKRSQAVNGSPTGRQLWSQGRFGRESVFSSSIGLEKKAGQILAQNGGLLLPVEVLNDQFSVFGRRQRPVANHQSKGVGYFDAGRENGLAHSSRFDLGADALQLVEEIRLDSLNYLARP